MPTKYNFGLIFIVWSMFPLFSAYCGGHEECDMCHQNTSKKEYKLIIKPNLITINPSTKKPYGKTDALCISSCHELHSKSSHPVGIVPNSPKVKIPKEALGFSAQEREITCLSCHDPHPEDKNYRYLRWPVESIYNLAGFCIKCHTDHGPLTR